jgi:hypothetical protein
MGFEESDGSFDVEDRAGKRPVSSRGGELVVDAGDGVSPGELGGGRVRYVGPASSDPAAAVQVDDRREATGLVGVLGQVKVE